eukprot:4243256-Prymnesium_polylepis.1
MHARRTRLQRRRAEKIATVSRFSRQLEHVVKARRLERKPLKSRDPPCLDAREAERPRLSASFCWTGL